MKKIKIGALSFQGGVSEHISATINAVRAIGRGECEVVAVKRKKNSWSWMRLSFLVEKAQFFHVL